ncbi:GntR family transcriptional regulator [Arthrobacter rhombi]|uniref:GntR family transcriptional regulator n=1 Tax=Arthrobacter rhombi TaxID=71253 RepID=UPI0031D459E4
MPKTPPPASSGRDKAYDYLREHVLVDARMQGRFLNEKQLAEEIGVSRTPVREALLLLVADGLVEMIPQRGAQIPVLSGRDISELMEMRQVLEVHAAEVALASGNPPIGEMEQIIAEQEALRSAGGEDNAQAFIERDAAFHQVLIDSTGNALMSASYNKLRVRQVLVGVAALYRSADRQLHVCQEHRGIVEALRADDATAARAAIVSHLAVTRDVLLRA